MHAGNHQVFIVDHNNGNVLHPGISSLSSGITAVCTAILGPAIPLDVATELEILRPSRCARPRRRRL